MNALLAALLCERFGHDPTRHPSGTWWCRRCSHVAAQMLAARDGLALPVKRPALGKGSPVPDDPFDLAVDDEWNPR